MILGAVTTSNERIARIGQILARSNQTVGGPQDPPALNQLEGQNAFQANPSLQTVVTQVLLSQQQAFQAAYRPVNVNPGSQTEVACVLPPLPPSLPIFLPQNEGFRARGQGSNVL